MPSFTVNARCADTSAQGVDYGGGRSQGLADAEQELTGKREPFRVFQRSNGRLHAFFFGEQYRLTDEAVEFYQPIFDRALEDGGYRLDVSKVRFTVDETLSAPGRWIGGMEVLLDKAPGSNFAASFKVATHEMFHIAQGLLAGNGDLAAGYALVRAEYSVATGWSRPFDRLRWDQISPGIDRPYEDAAARFGDSLFDTFYGGRR